MANLLRTQLDFSAIFPSGRYSDTTIMVDDLDDSGSKVIRSIPAHRGILAAGSTFFRDIFDSCQGNSGPVYLRGMNYQPVFQCLHLLYLGTVSITDDSERNEFNRVCEELGLRHEQVEPRSEQKPASSASDQGPSVKPDPDADTDALMDLSELAEMNPEIKPAVKPLPPAPISSEDYQERIRQLVKRNPETGSPMCSFCKKEFVNKSNAVNHIKNLHLPRSDYPCPYCDKTFKNAVKKGGHIHNVHYEEHRLSKVFGTSEVGGQDQSQM